MSTAVENMQRIPFDALIGGPLNAAVLAQKVSAETSIEFIESVAFTKDEQGNYLPDLRNVTFTYEKDNAEGDPQSFNLTVPILSIVPIPYLRIDEVNIEFSAVLRDLYSYDRNTNTNVNAGLRFGTRRFGFNASVSRSSSTAARSSQDHTYNMNVKVRAVQDEIPRGLGRVLDILETVVTEKPV